MQLCNMCTKSRDDDAQTTLSAIASVGTRLIKTYGYTRPSAARYKHVLLFVVAADGYSKLARAVLTLKTMARHTEILFFDHWIVPYRKVNFLLTDNALNYVSTLCNILCRSGLFMVALPKPSKTSCIFTPNTVNIFPKFETSKNVNKFECVKFSASDLLALL